MVCGGLVVVGIWSLPAALALLAVIGWPLVREWTHDARVLSDPPGLLRFMVTLASGLGGPGKWSPSK